MFTTSRSARGDAGAALAGDVAAAGDVEDEDLHVDEGGRERRRQVVATGLDEHQVQRVEVGLEVLDGEQVGGDVVADRRVRARPGLDGADPLRVQHAGRAQESGVLVGVDVVGDDGDGQRARQLAAEQRDQRGLAGADGSADAQPQGTGGGAAGRGSRTRRWASGTEQPPRAARGPRPTARSSAPSLRGCRRRSSSHLQRPPRAASTVEGAVHPARPSSPGVAAGAA